MDPALAGRAIAWTFGLAPALLFILTWSTELTQVQRLTRTFALPVLAVEIAIVTVSFMGGFRLRVLQPLPMALLGALGVLAWTTAAAASFPVPALLRTGVYMIHFLFALAIVNLWHQRILDFDAMVRAILWGFLLFFALMIVFVASTDQTASQRVSGLPAFGNVRWFGYYAAAIVGLGAAGFLQGNRFALFGAAAGLAMVFWTGTRGALAAILIGFLASAILFREFRSATVWLRLMLCGLGGLALSFALSALANLGYEETFNVARSGSGGRIELWVEILQHIRLRPWFGWGEGQVAFAFEGQPFNLSQPHNIVLQVLHAWGVVGAVLCLALTVWAMPRFFKAHSPDAAPFRCGAIILAAYSFIDGPLYHSQSLSLFALCCAAAIAAGMSEGNDSVLPAEANRGSGVA